MDFLSKSVDYFQNGVSSGDATVIGILVALVVVFLTILLLALRGGSNTRRGVLLVGICDSGKTLIYNRLVNGTYVTSYTSIKENAGDYTIKGDTTKTLRVIDLPGHEKRRGKLEEYKSLARGIVFVIDSLTFQKETKDVAELLYTILTDKVISSNCPPILLVCNKQDQGLAKGAKVIQGLLEKEINIVRVTQSAALDGTEKVANSKAFLGKRGKDFRFEDLKPLTVDFAECSARGSREEGQFDLTALEDWLTRIA